LWDGKVGPWAERLQLKFSKLGQFSLLPSVGWESKTMGWWARVKVQQTRPTQPTTLCGMGK